jgi:hypothetical protein
VPPIPHSRASEVPNPDPDQAAIAIESRVFFIFRRRARSGPEKQ